MCQVKKTGATLKKRNEGKARREQTLWKSNKAICNRAYVFKLILKIGLSLSLSLNSTLVVESLFGQVILTKANES